eukprot:jgi/Chlat1/4357/Chrsp29S04512
MDEGGEAAAIALHAQPFDVTFHPSYRLVAAGLISGGVELHRFTDDSSEPVLRIAAHSESCRAIRFAEGGNFLLSASADKSILATDTVTGQTVARLTDAHSSPINRLCEVSETTLASGDDDGCVKVWDTRQRQCCCSIDAHEDFVADMVFSESTGLLLGAGGDGVLSVSNLRKGKLEAQSENVEDELLSIVILKSGRKVCCGSQDGVLEVYSWNEWGDISDRFPGHPQSVDALVKVDEDTVISGSSDGLIRIVSIHPNKMLGIVGEHADYPIERLAMSFDGAMLASASHDNLVKLWNIAYLHEDGDEDMKAREEAPAQPAPDMSDSDEDVTKQSKRKRKNKGRKKGSDGAGSSRRSSGFFADL